jgi:type IV fimbrial biogenesis protein FimT
MKNSRVRHAAEVFLSDAMKAKAEAAQRNRSIELALLANPFTTGNDAAVSSSQGWAVRCSPWDLCARPDEIGTPPNPLPDAYYIDRMSLNDDGSAVTVTAVNADATAATGLSFTSLGGTNTSQRIDFNFTHNSGTCIANGGSIRCLRVQITPTGKVRICDPDPAITTASDTRRCDT